MQAMNWVSGFANSTHLISDPKIRKFITQNSKHLVSLNSSNIFFYNFKEASNNLYDKLCIFVALFPMDRIKFLINFILSYTIYRIFFVYKFMYLKKKKKEYVCSYFLRLFYFIKTKIFTVREKLKDDML